MVFNLKVIICEFIRSSHASELHKRDRRPIIGRERLMMAVNFPSHIAISYDLISGAETGRLSKSSILNNLNTICSQ